MPRPKQETRFTPAVRRSFLAAFILTEFSHVFCCILPTVVTVVSVMASLGLVIQMPSFMMGFHHLIHAYEIPVMMFSAAMLAFGWAAEGLAVRTTCADAACPDHQGPAGDTCPPHKRTMRIALIVASVLFIANVVVYVTLHRGMDADMHPTAGHGEMTEAPAPMDHMHH